MKNRKIRGHKRRQNGVEQWRLSYINLRPELIEEYGHQWSKIYIHPWCDRPIINSGFPEPKGKTKQLIISGLLDVYYSWKKQLDKMEQSYYLKIWLYEPHFSKSEVVCAIGSKIAHYENLFYKPELNKLFQTRNYGNLKSRLDALSWEYRLDEDHVESDCVGVAGDYKTYSDFLQMQSGFNRAIKKPHRTTKIDDQREYYSFKRGDLWIGG